MKKYIYKITNLINNKVYVGQTNNLQRRLKEHWYDNRERVLQKAIKKHGEENFKYEVLYHGEDYNNEEIKWIAYYDSTNKSKGYNIAIGGQDSSGELNPMSKISQEQADEIINLLLTTSLQHEEIANQLNINVTFVNHINVGESWRNDDYDYPLRTNRINNEQYNKILDKLRNTKMNFDEIAKELSMHRSVIQNINTGETYRKDNIIYPIRKRYIDKTIVNEIKQLLKDSAMYYKDIAKSTNTSVSIVSKINYGTAWKDENEIYPIRNK